MGAIEPLIDSTEDVPGVEGEPRNLKIPIDERFFAGGDFSHRAYDRDELGIPGATLFPDRRGRGGNGLLPFNLDYHFPLGDQLDPEPGTDDRYHLYLAVANPF